MKKIIDLSLTLSEEYPTTWPGTMEYSHTLFKDSDSKTYFFTMDEHAGTHCDAPSHFIKKESKEEQESIEGHSLSLEAMQGSLVIIDVTHLKTHIYGESPLIEPEIIRKWEAEHRALQPKDIVVFFTNWTRFYDKEEDVKLYYLIKPVKEKSAYGWPTPSVATLEYLHNKQVQCIGIDAPSIGAVHDGISPHVYGLSKNMIFIENLTNLHLLPPTGSYFIFLPLKIEHSTGCPGRAIAYIE